MPCSTGLSWLVGEAHLVEAHIARNRGQVDDAPRLVILLLLAQNLAGAVQAGDRLGKLRADIHHLKDRSDHEGQEHRVLDIAARREAIAQRSPSAEVHHQRAHQTHHPGRGKRQHRGQRHRLHHVVQQALHAAGEDARLAALGVVALHHPYAAQRLGKSPGDLGIDLAALAEDRPHDAQRLLQQRGEENDDGEDDERDHGADLHQHHERDQRGDDTADKVHQAGADQVAHALDVGHDARHQYAGAVRVVEADRQPADVLLHLLAQFGDHALRRLGEQLRQRERGGSLNGGGASARRR